MSAESIPTREYDYDKDFTYVLWEEYMVLVDGGKPLAEAMADYQEDMAQVNGSDE